MYLPVHFAETRPEVLRRFVAAHPFGLLVTQTGDGELLANGLPFLLDVGLDGNGSGAGTLRGHVARANPVWRDSDPGSPVLVVFQGPQAYVSPSAYPSKAEHGRVVPTWNYLMVQARGRMRPVDDAGWLRRFVTRLTEHHEASRQAPWAVADAPPAFTAALLQAIVGIEIELTALTGKWKASQNRSAADREGVARDLEQAGDEQRRTLAQQVREPGQAPLR